MTSNLNHADLYPPPPGPADEVLQDLVYAVEARRALEFPITLYLGGTTISGLLVSQSRFMDGVAGQTAQLAVMPLDQTALEGMFEKRADDLADAPLSDDLTHREPGWLARVEYAHLRKAVVIDTAGSATLHQLEIEWWRGRLDSVSAWHLGGVG